jgi:hypothetical protein
VVLRRRTIGADAFMRERLHAWYGPREVRRRNEGCAYIMAHADQPATLWGHADKAAWERAVKTWLRGVGLEYADLVQALLDFLGAEVQAREAAARVANTQPVAYGWLAAVLTETYGQTPDYWIWRAADHEVVSAIRRMRERRGAEAGKAPDPNDPAIGELREFRRAESEFRARKLAGVNHA